MSQPNNQENTESQAEKYQTYIRIRWFVIRLVMVLYDILAVNLAYFLALVVRFYVGGQVNVYATWCFPAFLTFAPYYTVCCLAVFAAFRLYSGMWKYAGINDMNRIIGASVVTCLIQVFGTLLFVTRMPITYYFLGAMIQFLLIAGSRFSYRLISAERMVALKGRKQTELNVMIVGVGETARIVRKQIESDHTNVANPVCMFSCTDQNVTGMMDGVPVLGGMDKLKDAISKYHVECVILADSIMTEKNRKQIKTICQEAEVGVQDFSGYLQNDGSDLSLMKLMQYTSGPVEIVIDGVTQAFSNGEQAVMSVEGKYDVRSVSVRGGSLVVEISKHQTLLNNLNEDWVQEFERETGEDISFF